MAAKGVELASAYVSLSVNTSKIGDEIKAAFNGAGKYGDQAGHDMGSRMAAAAAGEMSRGGTQAGSRYASSVSSSASAPMSAAGRNAAGKFHTGFQSEAEARGARVGTAVGTVIGRSIGGAISLGIKGAALGAAGAVSALGYTMFKGFERLQAIDDAKFTLKALGRSASEVTAIMEDARIAVDKTAFSLADAASLAGTAVAAGIKPGEQLTQYLKDIADAAAVTHSPLEDMGRIFNKIQTTNQVYLEDLQQLPQIPIFQWLQEEYGVTADALSKMVSKGEVDAQHFEKAIEDHIGGAAQKMGQSFSGAVDNMQTSVARVGADFLTAIFGGNNDSALAGPTGAVVTITNKLNDLDTWVKGHQGDIRQFFADAANVAKDVATAVRDVGGFLREHTEILLASAAIWGTWKAIEATATVASTLKTISTLLGVTLPAEAAVGGAAVGSGFTGGLSAAGFILRGGVWMLPAAIAYSIIWGDRDSNPQTQTSGGPGQPQLPGTGISGQAPPSNGNPTPGLFSPSSTPGQGLGGPPGAQRERRGGAGGSSFGHPGPPQIGGGNALPGNIPGAPGGGGVKGMAYNAMISHGWGADQWSALDQLIMHESGYSPTAHNPSGAHGIGQFMPYTWAGVGGSKTDDPGLQLEYMMRYIAQRYGSPSAAWAQYYNHAGGEGSYATGGGVHGPGGPRGDKIPAWLSDDEHVFTADDVAAMGGQSGVYAFRNSLHRAGGGPAPLGNIGIDPNWIIDPNTGARVPRRHGALWDNLQGEPLPRTAGPNDPLIPYFPPKGVLPPNIWGEYGPGEWNPSDPDFPKPDSPRDIYRRGRRGVQGFAEGGPVDINQLLAMLAGGDQHGLAQGAAPGPQDQQQTPPPAETSGRTEGYIPAGAGNAGPVGAGIAGSLLELGNEAVAGAIDMGAAAASMGAAGAPGAGAGIKVGADIAKRLSSYGFQMAGIGIGAITEILTPFGAPRWLSDVNPTSFMPHFGTSPAAVTTSEKAQLAQQAPPMPPGSDHLPPGAQPGTPIPPGPPDGPVQPGQMPGSGAPGQQIAVPPQAPPGSLPLPGQGIADPTAGPSNHKPGPPPGPGQPGQPDEWWKRFGLFDSGGVLHPNSGAINLSNQPEYVLTQGQMKQIGANAQHAASGGPLVGTMHVTGFSPDEVGDTITRKLRLAALQYGGRPWG